MKTKNNGKLLVWFCDKVCALANLFGEPVEEEYLGKRLPEIAAGVYEVRNARLKMKEIYENVSWIDHYLARADNALYEVDRVIREKPIDIRRAEWARTMLIECAREFAEVWEEDHYDAAVKEKPNKAHVLDSFSTVQ